MPMTAALIYLQIIRWLDVCTLTFCRIRVARCLLNGISMREKNETCFFFFNNNSRPTAVLILWNIAKTTHNNNNNNCSSTVPVDNFRRKIVVRVGVFFDYSIAVPLSRQSSQPEHVARRIKDAAVLAVLAFLGRLNVPPQPRGVRANGRPAGCARGRLAVNKICYLITTNKISTTVLFQMVFAARPRG